MGGAEAHNGPLGQRPPATLVIVAAGSGERLGADRPKALVPVAGRPMYEWSLAAAARAARIGAVVIAAPAGYEGEFAPLAGGRGGDSAGGPGQEGEGLDLQVVTGGAVRSESVLRALAAVESDLVIVHDAARPLVNPALFDLALARLDADLDLAAVVAAAPVTDTIKRCLPGVGKGALPTVAETLDRSELWAVQTPQAFRGDVLRQALAAGGELAAATDDAMLVEALGCRVAILPASPSNFKVTTAEDLSRAESELGSRDR